MKTEENFLETKTRVVLVFFVTYVSNVVLNVDPLYARVTAEMNQEIPLEGVQCGLVRGYFVYIVMNKEVCFIHVMNVARIFVNLVTEKRHVLTRVFPFALLAT